MFKNGQTSVTGVYDQGTLLLQQQKGMLNKSMW